MSTFILVAAVVALWAAILVKTVQAANRLEPWQVWTPPAAWLVEAQCIHRYETYGLAPWSWASWHDTRNPESRGGMQFLPSTWRSVGGTGDPARATRKEQLYRAWILWKRSGFSWRQWTTARRCNLR